MFIENSEYLISILVYLVISSLLCVSPTSKANRILKSIYKINNYKRNITKLLTLSMKSSNIIRAISDIDSITRETYKLLNNLDENKKTDSIRKLHIKQLEDLEEVKHLLTMTLVSSKINHRNPTYDDLLPILKLYRPIYTKIHTRIVMDDLLL